MHAGLILISCIKYYIITNTSDRLVTQGYKYLHNTLCVMSQTFQEFVFYETPSVCKAILNSCAHQTKKYKLWNKRYPNSFHEFNKENY